MPFSFPAPEQLVNIEHSDDSSTFPYPDIPVDKNLCRLLGPTALVVQTLMGGLVIASLIYKRQREKPMRPWRIWLFDVSKQLLGQAFVHGLNLIISDLVANLAQGNPCILYFLNVLIDTTLGVAYIYLILHGTNKLFTDYLQLKGFKSGQYGDPPSIAYWGRQAAVYVITILTMKLLVVGLFAAWPGIFDVGEWLLSWTKGNAKLQIIFVMGIFPIIMNVLQFWLIDSIVKASSSFSPIDDVAATDNDDSRQPLFYDPESDEDDTDSIRARRRHDIESPPTPQQKAPSRSDIGSEHKSTASGSSTSVTESASRKLHAYPPQRSSSTGSSAIVDAYTTPTSPDSASTSSSISSMRSKKSRRRSPPPPIRRPPPPSTSTLYTISMTPSPFVTKSSQHTSISYPIPPSQPQTQPRQRHRSTQSHGASRAKVSTEPETQAWSNWGKGDDWAEKVGEEDWTGRRMGATRAELDAWGSKGIPGVEVS